MTGFLWTSSGSGCGLVRGVWFGVCGCVATEPVSVTFLLSVKASLLEFYPAAVVSALIPARSAQTSDNIGEMELWSLWGKHHLLQTSCSTSQQTQTDLQTKEDDLWRKWNRLSCPTMSSHRSLVTCHLCSCSFWRQKISGWRIRHSVFGVSLSCIWFHSSSLTENIFGFYTSCQDATVRDIFPVVIF